MVKSAEELGCEVVAEGVETVEEWKIVREMGIRYSQGYLFQKPAAVASVGDLPRSFPLPEIVSSGVRASVTEIVTGS